MTEITITHTAADGTLADGMVRGDGTYELLKANGFHWFRSLGLMGIQASRDRQPNEHKISRAARALTAAGHTVTVEIDRTHRDPAQAEADRAARQADRVAALENKAHRRAADAEAAWTAEQRAAAALPPGGEPIKVGHHSEARHRRAIDRAHNTLGKAVAADRDADHAAHRAESAARTTEQRYSPVTVANRIQKLEAEQRADQRALDGHTRTLFTDARGVKHTEETTAATGEYRERIIARMAERAANITYWQGIRATQIADGQAGDYSPDTITAGDLVKIRHHGWTPVLRTNTKTVSVQTPAPFGGRMIRHTVPYPELQGHRPQNATTATTEDAAMA
ncbi:DUF3560 domain-containing protein [Gordonia McavH-238-E]|uniref:DUF3560 domain-containing protein n=1 Tax=Gordonia sp. McavH-238-E TaxID=2917736 RepID=UPI001EF5573F|nr:DUF3560 domain-containing protein [Gordonia sp. McavH-238-E]MCG7635318.1 DUF3560 domain-containing protein [Gordonia sp. McavH-238-E]